MCENTSYLCRLCLKASEFRFSLFTGNIISKIESLAAIKVQKDDKLPQTCCETCVANVYTSYKFQQCIIKSDRALRERLNQSESQIIEQAKQAPHLFEVLHLDGTSDVSGGEGVVEVKPKNEFIDSNDKDDFLHHTCKSEPTEESSHCDEVISNFLTSDDSLENSITSSLDNKSRVEYIDVDNFVETLQALESGQDISNEFIIKQRLELEKEVNVAANNGDSKKLNFMEKNLEPLSNKRKREASNADTVANKSRNGSSKLYVQNKLEKGLSVFSEKQKGNKSVECPDCDKSFGSKRMLQRHMIKHKIEKCPFCYITMRSDNLKRHIQTHTDSPEVCEICGKIAKNKESLRGHVNYQHKNNKSVKCEMCSKEFKSNYHYKSHVKKVHLGIRNHQCHICGKKFFANHDLNKHINMTHRGARPYICQYCKKGFSSPYARKTHIRQHTLETPFRCEICAAGFRQKVSLVTHLKSKHSIDIKKVEDVITKTENDSECK